ncbi:DUF4062 domain-containing protein [Bradyrhizobium sp. 33ap4]|uniref:DUF4062 domain-containing protein n=1 Tax=Bradyrhizobium sp. 33ap4 TaxID=3061630 RepID=UPI00293179B9|nr:DUF4062 domain-containing protein [Bradyrhizobium sp. 33ap4]
MSSSRKIVQIFLASPSDLPNERQVAKLAIDSFNKQWADWLGIQVELVGWEDTFKRFGRPQEQINLDLDRCEAFIGMLWRKWGTPPSKDSGPYTSGFEEEFERALASRRRFGRPEMTLFLKKIDPEFLKDQGPDIKKVLDFKERIHKEHLILYEEFDALAEFEDKLVTWITRYVQQLKRQEAQAPTDDTKVGPTEIANATQAPDQPLDTPLSREGIQFIQAFVAKTQRDRETHSIEAVEVARFRLLGSMIGVVGNDNSTLAVHDANILFRWRTRVELSRKEMEALIDSGLDNIANAVVPFWYWYIAANARETGYLSLASVVGPQSQRAGALRAMRLIGETIRPLALPDDQEDAISRSDIVRSWLISDREEAVKVAALDYLAVCGNETDLKVIQMEYEKRNYQTVGAATDAIIRINLRQSRESAVRALLELQPETLDDRLIDDLFAKPEALPTNLLLEGVTHRHSKVRSRIVTILVARGALRNEIAERLLDDSEASVRYEALLALLRDGRDVPDEKAKSILIKPATVSAGLGGLFGASLPSTKEGEAFAELFIRLKLRSQSDASLEKLCESVVAILDPNPRLALDFKKFRTRAAALRAAVDDEFRSEFNAAFRDLERRLIEGDTLRKLKETEGVFRKELVRKATDLLCEKNELIDLDRIRRGLSSGYVEFSRLYSEYFKKHGEWQDIGLLISLLDRADANYSLLGNLYDNEKTHRVAIAIHAIAKGRFSELTILPMPSRLLAQLIRLATDKEVSELDQKCLFAMFNSEIDDVRSAILPKVVKAVPKTRLTNLLAAYQDHDGARYYNVSYWLDLGISLSRNQRLHAIEVTSLKAL